MAPKGHLKAADETALEIDHLFGNGRIDEDFLYYAVLVAEAYRMAHHCREESVGYVALRDLKKRGESRIAPQKSNWLTVSDEIGANVTVISS